MGLFDLPAPVLSWLDGVLALALPDLARVIIWSAFAVALGFLLHQRLTTHPGENDVDRAKDQNSKAAILPIMVSILPALFMAVWINNNFEYAQPKTGTPVKMEIYSILSDITAGKKLPPAPRTDKFEKAWPIPDGRLVFRDTVAPTGSSFNAKPVRPVVAKKTWWNAFFGNPVGYIPKDFAIEEIRFKLAPNKMIASNSYILSNWKLWFVLTSMATLAGLIRFSRRS